MSDGGKNDAKKAKAADRKAARAAAEDAAAREDLERVYAHIVSRAPEHDVSPTIDRVARLLELLGDPQRSFRAIHLTGTNGKSSTARMAERLVREHGLRTGLFTSPHLTSVTERICVDGEPLSAARFVEVWEDVFPYVQVVDAELEESGQSRLNFFEVLTGLAFAAFADAPVDVAVLEVGMGGTWDTTNTVDAEVAVITPISIDHEKWLGSTPAEIAVVKAGIIKTGATAVVAEQRPEVDEVLAERAAEVRARLVREGVDLEVAARAIAVGGQLVALRTPLATYTDVFVPLHGAHQAHNALLALAAVEQMLGGRALDGGVVETAFADVAVPGRLELLRSSPTVLVDAAHNPHGAEALVAALDESFSLRAVVGVVGVMADKDAEGLLATLEPALSHVVLTRNSSERSADPYDLAEVAREIFGEDRVHTADRLDAALQVATDLAEADDVVGVGTGTGVVVTGSVITVADARVLLGRG
ncbi:bifunctional folylpolyglutamate synthase/dihydrofolate synthase [Isoptericola sp. S6320L]|uniref:bifunctional folylpolyglutamate synthase/dihydrofolate synthase n=1 Tax=Isoptericola sp. S6320L TaxID=2926411 RepID=UPI001FF5A562|nr:folylpolyglutamate synthase/dihydrofolate synthase family protein [Isoptericola sp. S6320L]MCK0117094.1 bifunctional folylpolyglutamate synthase/dihydrofolate synthase [Isoptericola sp. S6320L]